MQFSITLSAAERRTLLTYHGERRTGPHKMTMRIMHWRYCSQCGLLGLKNEATRQALRKPCVWEDD